VSFPWCRKDEFPINFDEFFVPFYANQTKNKNIPEFLLSFERNPRIRLERILKS